MAFPIKDCNCEDFPCCEHADNYPAEPQYCEECGYTYMANTCPCGNFYDEDEDEDYEEDLDDEMPQDELNDQSGR